MSEVPKIKRDYVVTDPTPFGQKHDNPLAEERYVWTPKRVIVLILSIAFIAAVTLIGAL